MKKIFNLIICLLIISLNTFSQTGTLKGIAHSSTSNEAIPFASVILMKDTTIIASTVCDMAGNFLIQTVAPGTYNLKVTAVGFQPAFNNNFIIVAGTTTFLDIKLIIGGKLNSIVITQHGIPLIDHASQGTQQTITYQEIQALPTRDVNSAAVKSAGVYRKSESKLNIRGSRSDATSYYVDGIKVAGSNPAPTPENYEQYDLINENQFFEVSHNPLSTFSIDVDAASYSNMRRFITQGNLPPADAVRIEEMINYFSYNYPQPTGDDPFSISTEVSTCPWNDKHRLIHIGLNGKEIATENLPESNLVFLIDVSGSMSAYNKLALLQKSFHLLVGQLRKEDRVSIVVYAGNAGLVLPSTRGNEKEKIFDAIDALSAGGSTAGGAGIELAYKIAKENFRKGGNNRVILATDGDFNVGVSDDDELVELIEKKREEGIFLTVLGFGMGNYKDGKMEKLADKGNGNFAYIDNILEANKVLVKEMGATLNTIAKDVKLQIEFNPSKVKAYRLIGYENRMLADRDFNDDKKDAGELGSGCTVTALYEIIPASSDEIVNDIDSLKYQSLTTLTKSDNNELMTVKFRYKDPDGSKSKLIVHPLIDEQIVVANTSDDFRFSAAVAEFGMLLRDSKFIGKVNFNDVIKLARASKGNDFEGYRAEFIKLAETAELIHRETAGKSDKR